MKSIKTLLFFAFFVISISKSIGQEITVFPGLWKVEYYQDDQEITKKELKNLFSKNEEVSAYWKKSNTYSTLAYTAIAAEVGFAIWTSSEINKEGSSNAVAPAIGTIGFAVLATIFLSSANKNGKKAILTYNKQFDSKTTFRIEPISNKNGLGLALKF